ncbi:MAG: T9SS type A sorting domain-containing protein [Candidatus Marinimicrobia bacterium]|nr:T9SS type A sorting domain-containing protein [Candidatus Neomarinimicrobiota bacterium]
MKKVCVSFLVILSVVSFLFSQETEWVYRSDMTIRFQESDSLANPYLCDTDSAGNLWVISSPLTSVGALNALYTAAPGDTVFTLFEDYSYITDVHTTRGVTTINKDVFVVFRSTTTDVSFVYEYPEGNPAAKIEYKGIPGFGTYVYGICMTKDRYMYGGIIYQGPRIRLWDFSGASSPIGLYVSPETTNRDPGGPSSTGEDVIRDVALQKNLDYNDSNSPIYTSRNSLKGGNQGGVTIWTGGTQTEPAGYTPLALEDADSFLKWSKYIPNGIFVDSTGILWAVGTDSSRLWVKGFQVEGSWATQVDELPSSTSGDLADPEGAPLNIPQDVAISPDGNYAYVIDAGNKCCYVFTRGDVNSVQENNLFNSESFLLNPVYPNPFNASTQISFQIPSESHVTITLYTLTGKPYQTLYSSFTSAGQHALPFNAPNDMSSGVYFVVMQSSFGKQIQKMILMK